MQSQICGNYITESTHSCGFMSFAGVPLSIPVANIMSCAIFSFDRCICCDRRLHCGCFDGILAALNKFSFIIMLKTSWRAHVFAFAPYWLSVFALGFSTLPTARCGNKVGAIFKNSLLKIGFAYFNYPYNKRIAITIFLLPNSCLYLPQKHLVKLSLAFLPLILSFIMITFVWFAIAISPTYMPLVHTSMHICRRNYNNRREVSTNSARTLWHATRVGCVVLQQLHPGKIKQFTFYIFRLTTDNKCNKKLTVLGSTPRAPDLHTIRPFIVR